MTLALASQFHVYLPLGQRPFSILSVLIVSSPRLWKHCRLIVCSSIQNCTHVHQELEEMYSMLTQMTCPNQVSGRCVDIDNFFVCYLVFALKCAGEGGKCWSDCVKGENVNKNSNLAMKMCYWELIAFYCIGTRQCKMYLCCAFCYIWICLVSDTFIFVSSRSSEIGEAVRQCGTDRRTRVWTGKLVRFKVK